jgi:spore coat-associated protein N
MDHAPSTVLPITAEERPSRRRRRGILALLLGLTTISLGAGMFSLAIFTDSDASTGTFTSGTVDINSNPTVAFTVTDMVPGDADTAALTISNDGTADLRYALSTVATNALGDTLTLTVKTEGTDCATFDGSTVLAATALDGAAIGSPAQGDDTGDRTLLAGDDEILCFRVTLPLATGNSAQGESSSATFTFDAEQVDNNP